MIQLLDMHKSFLTQHLHAGAVAVDFTMGNGHDTLFLAQNVGPSGHVYAFDIQEQALHNTEQRLRENGVLDRATLILDSHANVLDYVKDPICAGVFNLGYLPGSGNKALTTKRESTKMAVQGALELLDHDGILLIAVYPGHEEGKLEGEMLERWLSERSRFVDCVSTIKIINSPTSPYFIMVERK